MQGHKIDRGLRGCPRAWNLSEGSLEEEGHALNPPGFICMSWPDRLLHFMMRKHLHTENISALWLACTIKPTSLKSDASDIVAEHQHDWNPSVFASVSYRFSVFPLTSQKHASRWTVCAELSLGGTDCVNVNMWCPKTVWRPILTVLPPQSGRDRRAYRAMDEWMIVWEKLLVEEKVKWTGYMMCCQKQILGQNSFRYHPSNRIVH